MLISESEGEDLRTQDSTTLEKDGFRKIAPKFRIFLAETDQRDIVGMYMYSFKHVGYKKLTTNETSVYVHPQYRGQGIGSALLKATLQECLLLGCSSFCFTATPSNIASRNLHRKLKPKSLTSTNAFHLLQIMLPKNPVLSCSVTGVTVDFSKTEDVEAIMQLMKKISSVNENFTGIKLEDSEFWKASINGKTEMTIVVAKSFKQVIGCVSFITIYCNHLRSATLLDRIMVEEGHRGRGVALGMLAFSLKEAARRGSSIVQALVHVHNKRAMVLLERCGAVDATLRYGWRWYHCTMENIRAYVTDKDPAVNLRRTLKSTSLYCSCK